ncbi:VOC family protein [Dermatobacter hominis]|uniref:VOC family protein n=1 Tax=Dermatobacter hominis TaxID=2884263 RepID=UPI001D122335|nr:hypothetical protein [Dermatobacter hominis]UDY36701.1 hypothetical protein LH044_03965 [Dermatobacter hominis]
MLYHPSHHVPDLAEAEAFFARVFGRPSTPLSALARPGPDGSPPRRPVPDHSTFTPIADVLFDSIDPRRYVVAGQQRYADVDRPRLKGMGWYVDGIGSLHRSLLEHGYTVVDQLDRVVDGEEPPTAVGSPMPLLFTTPDDAGLRYELLPCIPFPLDPRLDDGWSLPPVADDDPLGIVRCSHHVVLTARPDRALRLALEVFGGTVVHRGRDDVLGATATWVHLADGIVEYAVPEPCTVAAGELAAVLPHDSYHSIAWQVADLDRVAEHLAAVDLGLVARTDDTLVVDPAAGLGIPWRFTTTTVPGDPRP